MTLLSELRRAGAEVSLSDKGGIQIRRAPAALVDRAKAGKASILASLSREKSGYGDYSESPLYWRIDDLYIGINRLAARGIAVEECNSLIDMLRDIDDAAHTDLEAAYVLRNEFSADAQRLCSVINEKRADLPLEDEALVRAAKIVFGADFAPPSPAPVPIPTGDVSALAPTAPPKRTGPNLAALAPVDQSGLFG